MNRKSYSGLAAALLLILAAPAFPETTKFTWYDEYNVLKNKSGAPIAIGNATVLTFLSDDTTVNANSAVGSGKLTLRSSYDDDQFYLGKGTIDYDGYYLTEYMIENSGAHIGKYVYAIIIDLPYATYTALGATEAERFANIPRDGSVYAGITSMGDIAGTVTKLANAEPPYGVPQSFHGGTVQTSYQVIPEPSTMGLIFGVAGVAGLWRRLRRR